MKNNQYDPAGTQIAELTEERISAWSPKRRDFMRTMGLGAGALAAVGLTGCSESYSATAADALRAQLLTDEAFWTSVQARFTLNPSKLFMNRHRWINASHSG
jgi:hypothetical protein